MKKLESDYQTARLNRDVKLYEQTFEFEEQKKIGEVIKLFLQMHTTKPVVQICMLLGLFKYTAMQIVSKHMCTCHPCICLHLLNDMRQH